MFGMIASSSMNKPNMEVVMSEDVEFKVSEPEREFEKTIFDYVYGGKDSRKEIYGKMLFEEAKKKFIDEIVLLKNIKSAEKAVTKWRNPITHTAKVVQSSSSVHLNGKTNAPIPEGYVTMSSVHSGCRDSGGAARYATVSKFLGSMVNGYETVKDLLNKKDIALKNELGLDEDDWNKLLKMNELSNKFYANPVTDGIAKQILFPISEGKYLNFTITPSTPFLFEYRERLNKRVYPGKKSKIKEIFNGRVKRTVGGSKPNNISDIVAKIGVMEVLRASPFFVIENKSKIDSRVRYGRFFRSLFFNKQRHSELFSSFSKLISVVDKNKYSNAKIERGLNNSFEYIVEQVIVVPALSLQLLPTGWSDDKNVKLTKVEKAWLDPGEAEMSSSQKDHIASLALESINRLFEKYRKSINQDPVDLRSARYKGRFENIIERSL